jgi:hypothetical protein
VRQPIGPCSNGFTRLLFRADMNNGEATPFVSRPDNGLDAVLAQRRQLSPGKVSVLGNDLDEIRPFRDPGCHKCIRILGIREHGSPRRGTSSLHLHRMPAWRSDTGAGALDGGQIGAIGGI